MSKRIVLASVSLAAGLGLCWWLFRADTGPVAPPPSGPNVLLIVLDTTRADVLSCYGDRRGTTPRIDALAAEGTRYARAYATCFWTLPSHATILTGLYPSEAGATSETNRLPGEVTTLAERLDTAGYATGAVVCNAWVSRERGFAQGFTDFVETWRAAGMPDPGASPAQGEDSVPQQAVAWIDRHADGARPFFLFININLPHLPYTPPRRLRDRFLTGDWPADRLEKAMRIVGEWAHFAGAVDLDETDLRILGELYAAEVAWCDEWVGMLVDALAERGVLDDTLVVVTSDHGENLGEHGMIGHALSMYEPTVRVPLVVRYPKRFKPGAVVVEPVSLIDLAPMILAVCGVQGANDLRSGERIGLLDSESEADAAVVAENDRPINGVEVLNKRFPEFDTGVIDRPLRMIRTERYKLIWHVGAGVELYDVWSDGGESTDIAERRPDLRDELLGRLERVMAEMERPGSVETFESEDRESIERLRALGYVE